jgi:hypothetical protein
LAILTILAGLTVFMSGQQRSMHVSILSRGPQLANEFPGIVDDWTNHHLVFSNPGTEEDAIRDGRHEEWVRIVNDPRYIMQQLRRRSPAQGPAAEYVASMIEPALGQEIGTGQELHVGELQDFLRVVKGTRPVMRSRQPIHTDWNENLETTSAVSYNSYPAKWSFSTSSASCSDYVVFPTGGSSSQASIIAYYNLYSGCGGTVPEVDWAYSTGGTVTLAPVLYYGGSQLAVVQSSSGGVASLVLVTYPNTPPGTGSLSSPITPNSVTPTNYFNLNLINGCSTAPCMTSVTFNGSSNDLTSNPYYDWGTDSLYVGDSAGYLHKFNPVFRGVLTEVTSSGWPLQLNTAANVSISSPVYDVTSACVFVGDNGVSNGSYGYLYSVNSGNSGKVCSSTTASINATSGHLASYFGIRDAPLVDSSAESVYAFVGHDASGASGVFQLPASFATGSSGTEAQVGTGATSHTAYQLAGTFDNTYYTSSSSSSPNGNLYVCGQTALPSILYQIPIVANVMNTTANTGPALSGSGIGSAGHCSPVTEFDNPNVGGTVTATGSVTMTTVPSGGFTSTTTVTVGSITYTFVTALSGSSPSNQVLYYTGSGSSTRADDAAGNLRAAIDNSASECVYTSSSACFRNNGSSANSAVTHPASISGNKVSLTAASSGSGGDFTISTNNPTDITVSGGENGSSGTDYIFLSVFYGSPTGCGDSTTTGCLMSFNVTTPSSFGTGMTPLGEFNMVAASNSFPTGGIIVDNAATSPTGASEIYFQVATTTSGTNCTTAGNCAVQATQAAP